jgi:hypothetical protein
MVFQYTGAHQSYSLPEDDLEVTIVAVGAGGGPGYNSMTGGPGGVTKVVVMTSALASRSFTVVVGGRGIRNAQTCSCVTASERSYGFGGAPMDGGYALAVGAGGGLSGVFLGTPSVANAIAVAGGGGGASGYVKGGSGNGVNSGTVGTMQGADGDSVWEGGGGGGCAGGRLHTRQATSTTWIGGEGGSGCAHASANTATLLASPEFSTTPPDYLSLLPAGIVAGGLGQGSVGYPAYSGASTATNGVVVISWN